MLEINSFFNKKQDYYCFYKYVAPLNPSFFLLSINLYTQLTLFRNPNLYFIIIILSHLVLHAMKWILPKKISAVLACCLLIGTGVLMHKKKANELYTYEMYQEKRLKDADFNKDGFLDKMEIKKAMASYD